MKATKLILSIILFSTFLSCSKKDDAPQLPAGENTAYYYLNGILVIPRGFLAGTSFQKPINVINCALPNNGTTLNFFNSNERLKIFLKPSLNIAGVTILNYGGSDSTCNYLESFGYLSLQNSTSGAYSYYSTTANSGQVVITKISSNKRQFSGTFRATLTDTNGQTMQITSGVFDINLDTL